MRIWTVFFASFTLGAAAPESKPIYRTFPVAGLQHYRYQVIQTINGNTQKGYRTEFDLEAKGGMLFAVVRSTSDLENGVWKAVVPDAACRKAMKGSQNTLARAQLYPTNPNADQELGAGFLDRCAPPAVFFPLTDILNVAVLPMPRTFRASELHSPGDSVTFPGFEAEYDRAGERLKETAQGGEMRLALLDQHRATLEWRPLPAKLMLVERAMVPPMTMDGTEHWAFRVEVDRRSGMIERASTLYDDLDLKIGGAPDNVRHMRIARNVTIERE